MHLPSDSVSAFQHGTTQDKFIAGATYEVVSLGSVASNGDDAHIVAASDLTNVNQVVVGAQFTVVSNQTTIDAQILAGTGTFKRILLKFPLKRASLN